MPGYKLQDTVHAVMITMGNMETLQNLSVMTPVLGMQVKYVEDILDKASTTQVSLKYFSFKIYYVHKYSMGITHSVVIQWLSYQNEKVRADRNDHGTTTEGVGKCTM